MTYTVETIPYISLYSVKGFLLANIILLSVHASPANVDKMVTGDSPDMIV